MNIVYMRCCGLKELDGIARISPLEVVRTIDAYTIVRSHLIFTSAGARSKYGDNLKAYIEQYKLGEVIRSKGAINSNSRRIVKAYVWTPDMEAIRAHVKKIQKGTL